jgi:Ca2+-binding EF-hand superfamily protein
MLGEKKMLKRDMVIGAILMSAISAGIISPAFAQNGPADGGGSPLIMFDTLDADKDGKVTVAEIEADRAAKVKAADANGDGLMSADELAAMQIAEMTERAKTRAAEMVTRLDADKDGLLSGAELATRHDPAKMFERFDTDEDGAISREEATAAAEMMAKGREGHGHRGHGHHDDDN